MSVSIETVRTIITWENNSILILFPENSFWELFIFQVKRSMVPHLSVLATTWSLNCFPRWNFKWNFKSVWNYWPMKRIFHRQTTGIRWKVTATESALFAWAGFHFFWIRTDGWWTSAERFRRCWFWGMKWVNDSKVNDTSRSTSIWLPQERPCWSINSNLSVIINWHSPSNIWSHGKLVVLLKLSYRENAPKGRSDVFLQWKQFTSSCLSNRTIIVLGFVEGQRHPSRASRAFVASSTLQYWKRGTTVKFYWFGIWCVLSPFLNWRHCYWPTASSLKISFGTTN